MMTIYRLTINPAGIQRDVEVLGDRALSAYVNQKSYIFSTYNYAVLDDLNSA
jgi:hypothetical protein